MHTVMMTQQTDKAARFSLDPRLGWTLIGLSAIPLWALWPLSAVVSSGSMPLFQFSAINYSVGAITLFALRSTRPTARVDVAAGRIWTSAWFSAVMFCVGSLISSIFFLWSLRYIPPAQANLITYLWPLMVVGLAVMVGQLTLRRHHVFSMMLGLIGAALVIGPNVAGGSLFGIGLALISGFLWAIFCVFRAWQGKDAPDAVVGGLAISAVVSIVIHFATEVTVMPPPLPLFLTIFNGILPLAIANLAWDVGFRRGNRVLLAVAAYGTPLVSALILTAFGFAQPTIGLIAGAVLIVAGGAISARR